MFRKILYVEEKMKTKKHSFLQRKNFFTALAKDEWYNYLNIGFKHPMVQNLHKNALIRLRVRELLSHKRLPDAFELSRAHRARTYINNT